MTVVLGGTRARKGGKKKAAGADALSEEESEVENLIVEQPRQKPRPRPKRVTRSNPVVEEEPADEPPAEEPSREPSPQQSVVAPEEDVSVRASTPDRPELDENQQTPKSSLKRPRTDDEEEADADAGGASADAEVTPVKDVQVRRKRIRH